MEHFPANPNAPRHLIINADDLGMARGRDEAILALFAQQAITSATLVVNGPTAAAAAAHADRLPLGLHLNLTEGLALSGPDAASNTLTGLNGQLRGKFGLRDALARHEIATSDLEREIRAQFERFIALTGELPTHVDGHHHIHVDPAVAEVLAPIMAREYGVYCVRLPHDPDRAPEIGGTGSNATPAFLRAVSTLAAAARPHFARHAIYAPDAFLGLHLMGSRLSPAAAAHALDKLCHAAAGPLWVELMVHPGSGPGPDEDNDFGHSPERAHEAAVLGSADWANATAHWQRVSFRDLPRPRTGTEGSPAQRPTILIYGKLTPATGNAETARRFEDAWAAQASIRFRPLLADPGDARAVAHEATRLRELAAREHLDLAVGIHVLRAGVPLARAFAARPVAKAARENDNATARPAYGLLASGTDANADITDPTRRQAMQDALAGADFLLCLTDDLRQRLAVLRLPADTTICPNGIDVRTDSAYSLRTSQGLPAGCRLILFPASLRQVKGVLPLLETLGEHVATRHPEHVLVILGPVLEPAYGAAVFNTLRRLEEHHPGVRGRLIHLPGLAHADYLAALREADLLLNASEHEGLSHGVMEAMAAGVPVLARDIPGNRLLIRDNENGRLFASFSALPARYDACFAAATETRRMADNARADIARHYPATQEADALRAVLARSLARQARP